MFKFAASFVGFILILAITALPFSFALAADPTPDSMTNITENTGIKSMQDVDKFLSTLQTAIRDNDHQTVVTLVKFPLTVNGKDHSHREYKNAKQVLDNFDKIFDAHTKDAILHAEPASKLFANDEGMMIGDGDVWFNGWDSKMDPGGAIGISAINH